MAACHLYGKEAVLLPTPFQTPAQWAADAQGFCIRLGSAVIALSNDHCGRALCNSSFYFLLFLSSLINSALFWTLSAGKNAPFEHKFFLLSSMCGKRMTTRALPEEVYFQASVRRVTCNFKNFIAEIPFFFSFFGGVGFFCFHKGDH